MTDTFHSAYQEELKRLDATKLEIESQLKWLRSIPEYTGDDFTEQVLEDSREVRRQRLAKAAEEPYFGRMDFQATNDSNTAELYIGKVGVNQGEEGKGKETPLVIDWRAPISSLFYSFTGGEGPAQYEAPEGTIEGLVYLKRNLVVRKQILQRVVDTYNRESDQPSVNDEFLLYRLGENKDNRLRDIVSTIQAEQDSIIRAAKNTALIIQGVAGSGKTTVALHRLAFLLYQYQEQIRAEKMIIFAPNHMFLNYISDVLPELGVGNIQQGTFPDWAMNLLDLKAKLAPSTALLSKWFGTIDNRPELNDDVSGRFKGSIRLQHLVDQSVKLLEINSVPDTDFSPWDGAVLPYKTIRVWFDEEYKHYALAKRKDRVMARINRWVEMELKKIYSAVKLKENKKKASQRMKTYANKWPNFDALTMYKAMFQAEPKMELPNEIVSEIPPQVATDTRKYLKKNQVLTEDLAALLYIHVQLHEIAGEDQFDHIVIDEAQDFSPLQIAVLDRFVRNHSFTILGDLSQGIHAYQGIQDWNEMQALFTPEETAYFALTRSYRSTTEIIEFANEILVRGVKTDLLAVPVFRSGQPVRVTPYTKAEQFGLISDALNEFKERAFNTTALLTRTLEEAVALYTELKEKGLDIHLIDGSQSKYEGGISVLPIYLSKGLEFDAVLVMDADDRHYEANMMDAKLLYVGCTRALHELWVLYEGKPTPLVPSS
ncbi:AAA family ATPase [Paenibacillus sp. N1-5-1-14]|uniref:HelD family protein n=1 Tax=Paenibacillus radicibacter TaxID=2972488 RepID=UPI0021590F8D|nr:3'-5' exonuclease [Paenibacillus radicibacter]MCR8642501.1 AAA family ATPase [Paenibacillus radicibacter]